MKKLFLFTALLAVCTTAAAQEFGKGDRRIDLTIGVGMIGRGEGSITSFDQHFGMEWGVASISDKVTVGLGFTINNTYGPCNGQIIGTYDYYYTQRYRVDINSRWESSQQHRQGMGWADARMAREDIDLQFTASFHYSPMAKLDVYSTIGVGVGVMNFCVGNIHNETNFSAATVNHQNTKGGGTSYSYNDLLNVKWQETKSKIVPAISVFVGATYYLTERWGVDAQVGLLAADIKKGYANSYSLFAVGASYKF